MWLCFHMVQAADGFEEMPLVLFEWMVLSLCLCGEVC